MFLNGVFLRMFQTGLMTQTMLLRSVFLFGMVFPYTVFAKLDGRQMVRESASSDTDNTVQGRQHFGLILADFPNLC